ncbi:MAG: hypothetical protein AVDCRST_MAG68-3358 [uncultured Gemmatimonadetes bacterium]|uniref:Uncharacterized protein n=1 Tax=uncultured Gemmatimonadota bacterium TaxID=203437 RepID=A0A6J4LKB0_9BACT|nr:MAG: hypothetical protein AVDCRST_MAG68-3358 [uncultured Gemmatimonadota bacterium]
MAETDPIQLLTRFRTALNRAVHANAIAETRHLLAQPIPREVLAVPAIHAQVRRLRGNTFTRLGDLDAAHAEYSAGFAEVPYSVRGDYLLDWAMTSVTPLFRPGPAEAKRASCLRGIHTLEAANDQAGYAAEGPYLRGSVASVRAFLHVYLAQPGAAQEQLRAIDLPALPPGSQGDPSLASFYSQMPKAFIAALELRSADAVERLCGGLLTKGEAARLDADALTPGGTFAAMVLLRTDTPKFLSSLAGFVHHAPALAPAFPVLRQLNQRLHGVLDPARIATFVDSACRA